MGLLDSWIFRHDFVEDEELNGIISMFVFEFVSLGGILWFIVIPKWAWGFSGWQLIMWVSIHTLILMLLFVLYYVIKGELNE